MQFQVVLVHHVVISWFILLQSYFVVHFTSVVISIQLAKAGHTLTHLHTPPPHTHTHQLLRQLSHYLNVYRSQYTEFSYQPLCTPKQLGEVCSEYAYSNIHCWLLLGCLSVRMCTEYQWQRTLDLINTHIHTVAGLNYDLACVQGDSNTTFYGNHIIS